jgi:hypothetical protein
MGAAALGIASAGLAVGGATRQFMAAGQLDKTAKLAQKFGLEDARSVLANSEEQARIATLNSLAVTFDARDEMTRARLQVKDIKRQGRRARGQIAAAAASSGIDIGVGSVLTVQDAQVREFEKASAFAQFESDRRVSNLLLEAEEQRIAARAARQGGRAEAKRVLRGARARALGLRQQAAATRTQAFLGLVSAGITAGSQLSQGSSK